MNGAGDNPKRWKKAVIAAAVAVVLLLTGFVGVGWYSTTDSFRAWIRARLVQRIEEATGGKVELADLKWNLLRLEFEFRGLTIHGTEAADQEPYLHADRVLVRAKILSLVEQKIGLNSIEIDRPVFHLIVYPDGHTNQPVPKKARSNSGSVLEKLFELDIHNAQVRNGVLIVNEHRMRISGNAEDVQARMVYDRSRKAYGGSISIGALDAAYQKYLPPQAAVKLDFDLFRDNLQVASFHVAAGKSVVDATGNVQHFSHPELHLSYRTSLDVAQVAELAAISELKSGTIELAGTLSGQASSFTTSGKGNMRGVEYRTAELRVRDIDVAGDYFADQQRIDISHVVARMLGGIANGTVSFENWDTVSGGASKPELKGSAQFRIDNFSVEQASAAYRSRKADISRLHLAGRGAGAIDLRWRRSFSDPVANLSFHVVPPEQTRAGQIPLTADLQGVYFAGSGMLQVNPFNAATPFLRLSARGKLGSNNDQLQLSLAVTDLAKLQPMYASVTDEKSIGSQLAGKLTFTGTLSGRIANPNVAGRVEVADFAFPVSTVILQTTLPEPISSEFRRPRPNFMHLDTASGDVQYGSTGLLVRNGQLRRGGAQASFDLSARLSAGTLTDSDPVAAHLVIRNAQLADLQQIAGYNYPIAGTVSANLTVTGTRGNPEAGGHVDLTNVTAYDEAIQTISTGLRLENQEVIVNSANVQANGAHLKGFGAYNLKSTQFRFQVTGSNFDISKIRRLQKFKLKSAGIMSFSASGSGTTQTPVINADAHIHGLVINGERVGDAHLIAVTTGDTLRLTANTNFQSATLDTDGSIKMRGDFPGLIKLKFANFDFTPYLVNALPGDLKGKSAVAGTITIQGALKHPRELTITAEIPQLAAEVQGVHLHNGEPIRLSMANEVIRLDSLHLIGDDTQLTAGGIAELGGERRLRLHGEGRLNLKLVQTLNPDVNSSGNIDFNLRVSGQMGRPAISGQVQINDGSVNFIDFPNGLSHINGAIAFNEDRAVVQNLSARTGGGEIRIGGFATYNPGLALNLTFQGDAVRLRYPQGVSSTANVDLKLTGTLNSSNLVGDVTVTKFGLNKQFDLGSYLAKFKQLPPAPTSSPISNLHLNVHVVSTPELQVQSSLAKLSGNVDLRVRGTAINPIVLGRVNLTEGQVTFSGTNYRLDRGDITFANPTVTEPTIDLEATTRVQDYDITIGFHGQPERGLKTSYRSDPPLPASDIISLLAFGRTRDETTLVTDQTTTTTESVSNAILGQAINSAVSDRMQKLFGISRIKIAPDVGTTQTNPTAQVTIEQQVSNKVTITYVTNLSQASQQAIFVEYYINRDLSIIAGRDQYGVVSFDIKQRRRKR